ncbi:glycosyltransferase family 39 protein [Actinosynnema sp. NPDC023587]|uniref:ArnT family glycosyltransferase n=1 Tax=Actinosynnema sp. NPDC023587 TaxID=3154695 RepID=UPI0033D940DF
MSTPVPPFARLPVLLVGGASAVLLILTSGGYGSAGDELYFVVAGRHPAWSYADQPPLVPLLARLMTSVDAESWVVLRLPVSLAIPSAAVVTALLTREFGGGARSQVLAAGVFLLSPHVLSDSHTLTKAPLGLALSTVSVWLLVRWARTGDDRLWPAIGVAVALALQANSVFAAFWVIVVAVLAVIGPRKAFRSPWLWAGAATPVLTAVPGLVWQAAHGWPQLGMAGAISAEGSAVGGPLLFVPLVLATAGVVGAVLLVVGLRWLVRGDHPYRFIGYAVVVLALAVWSAGGRRDYLADSAFAVCWAAAVAEVGRGGAAAWWRWVPTWPVLALTAAFLVRGIVPVGVDWTGGADRYFVVLHDKDWRGMAAAVAEAYRTAPPGPKALIAGDYRRAAALDRYRTEFSLPPVYGDMRGYWHFGRPPEVRTVVYVGVVPDLLRAHCGRLELLTSYRDPGADPVDNRDAVADVTLCQDLTVPMADLWPRLYHLDNRLPG